MSRPTGMECEGSEFAKPTRSSSVFDQQIGRTLRRKPEASSEVTGSGGRRMSLADAQRLGFLPTIEVIPAEGTVGVGQYVRETEPETTLPSYDELLPSGFVTKEGLAASLDIDPRTLHQIIQQQQPQQPQGESN